MAVILPTLILVWASLLRYYVPFSPDNFHLVSLHNYRLIFAGMILTPQEHHDYGLCGRHCLHAPGW